MNLKQYGVSPNMEKEVSCRFIAHLTGLLLAFESMLLLACCCVSMIYSERESDIPVIVYEYKYTDDKVNN